MDLRNLPLVQVTTLSDADFKNIEQIFIGRKIEVHFDLLLCQAGIFGN